MSPQALAVALDEAATAGALPKAVVVVNIYGQSADYDRIKRLCDLHSVPVVEDAAESLGATYKGCQSGGAGRVGVFSFNGNKIITTSGGGILVSNDEELVREARFLSTQAREPAPHYEHRVAGYNYRMSNVLAGIGRGQLRVLEDRVAARRSVFERYREALSDVAAIRWMPEAAYGRCTRWLTAFVIDRQVSAVTPAKVLERLAAERIEARPVWKPMHLQPLFAGARYYPHEPGNSTTDLLFRDGVCLPSGSNMTSEQQGRVIDALRRCFGAPARQ
jgi:pyridoxal phosphate-dependent aminotransferase EpsN